MLKYVPDSGDWSRRHLTPSPTSGGAAPGTRDPPPALTVQASGDNVSPSTTPGTPSWRTTDPGYITVGYRGTFAFGRDGGQADVKFRKLWRILVSGRVALCREVLGVLLFFFYIHPHLVEDAACVLCSISWIKTVVI